MKFFYILYLVSLSSCFSFSYKVVPLKGSYSSGNFEAYSDKSKDVVWDNIIDFFAKNGISIKIIDRSSGLIISEQTIMSYSRENSKGELIYKNAFVAVHKIIDPATKKVIPYQSVTAEWNIRIKEASGKTLINVNMVNPTYEGTDGKKTLFKAGSFQSTGVFEKTIYDLVK